MVRIRVKNSRILVAVRRRPAEAEGAPAAKRAFTKPR